MHHWLWKASYLQTQWDVMSREYWTHPISQSMLLVMPGRDVQLLLSLALSYRTPHTGWVCTRPLCVQHLQNVTVSIQSTITPRERCDSGVDLRWDESGLLHLRSQRRRNRPGLKNETRLAIAHKWQNYREVFARVPVCLRAAAPCAIVKLPSLCRCSNIFSPSASQGIRK